MKIWPTFVADPNIRPALWARLLSRVARKPFTRKLRAQLHSLVVEFSAKRAVLVERIQPAVSEAEGSVAGRIDWRRGEEVKIDGLAICLESCRIESGEVG